MVRPFTLGRVVPWEMIMPSFQFIVGAALPFALARRLRQDQPFGQMCWHVIRHCVCLVIIGQLLWHGFEGPGTYSIRLRR